MTRPACRVYLGFGSTWLTEPGSITWTEVTSRVMDRRQPISTMRGSTSWHGEPDVGVLSLTLRNSDRHLDPLHETGPHYGDLIPGVPVKVEGTPLGQSTVGVWWGSVKSWPQRYDRGNRIATVPIKAFDGFDKLARAKIPRSPIEVEVLADSPVGWWRLDETTGDVMVDYSGNDHDGTYDEGTTSLSTDLPVGDEVIYRSIAFDGSHKGAVADLAAIPTGSMSVEVIVDLDDLASAPGELYSIYEHGFGSMTDRCVVSVERDGTTYKVLFEVVKSDGTVSGIQTVVGFQFWGSGSTDGGTHHVAFTRNSSGGTLAGYRDGVLSWGLVSGNLASPMSGVLIGAPKNDPTGYNPYVGRIAHVITYNTALSGARVAAHYDALVEALSGQTTDQRISWILDEIGWPAGLRNLETGKTTLGPATFQPGDGALNYLRLCAATEDGLLFITADGKIRLLDRYWRYTNTAATAPQITFTDDGSGISVSNLELEPADDELLVNVARFTRRGGTEQVAVNTASRALYGEAGKQRTDLLHRTDGETRSQAEWTVATQGTPTPRIPRVTVNLHKLPPERQAQLLALELGHRVRCTRTPQAVGAAFSIDLVVDGIKNAVTATEWVMELFLSPAPDQTLGLLLWDSGLWDDADAVWAY